MADDFDDDFDDDDFEDDDDLDDDDDLEDEVEAIEEIADDEEDEDESEEADESDDEDVLDLEEELHPDDVEAPLDALLAERIAAGGLDDDDEDMIDESGRTKVIPRRDTEFHCSSCFLVLPNHMLADKKKMLCRDCS